MSTRYIPTYREEPDEPKKPSGPSQPAASSAQKPLILQKAQPIIAEELGRQIVLSLEAVKRSNDQRLQMDRQLMETMERLIQTIREVFK